jgi:hypothetical protein
MNNDLQISQLKNNFFSVDDDEIKHITNNLSTQSTDIKEDFLNFKGVLPSNSFLGINFNNPKDTNSIIPPNKGKIKRNWNDNVMQYQQKDDSDEEVDNRTNNALIELANERTGNNDKNAPQWLQPNKRTNLNMQPNQLKNRIIISQLSIDSKFRKDYFNTQSTDFIIDLTTSLKNVISMRLASLEIPNISHVISANLGTNSFKFTKDNISTHVTIPSGNYEYWLLASKINAATSQNGGNLTSLGATISIDATSLRTTIKSTTGSPINIDFGNPVNPQAPPMRTLGWLLGFRNRKYEGHTEYTSEGAVDMAGSKYFFLCINDFNQSVHDVVTAVYENSFMQDNILARIPMREGKGVVLFDDCTDKITKKRHYFGPVNINKLHIKIIDEFGMPIDLLAADYSLALEFQILYEK